MFFLESLDNVLTITHRDTDREKPEATCVAWPVKGACTGAQFTDWYPHLPLPLAVTYTSGQPGFYRDLPNYQHMHFDTEKTGTFSSTPLPCPKVRKGIPTRYANGKWEKYLQSQGWVRA